MCEIIVSRFNRTVLEGTEQDVSLSELDEHERCRRVATRMGSADVSRANGAIPAPASAL